MALSALQCPLRPVGFHRGASYGAFFFRGPNNEDHSILGPLLGSPYFGKLPYSLGH